ncbi:MAG: AAA family ATPase, partial [bacterium]|nr:AAA family ATPase [bacterium]
MLTRLRINGFKNLVDVDIAFGPFTCVAGLNGVGKSNLFDAIRFLSALADLPLREAALSTRGEGARTSEIKGLFHRVGDHSATEMQFDAEMLIAAAGIDDLGQGVTAAMTWVRYQLTLALEGQGLHVRREVLSSIPPDEAEKRLRFPHLPVWRDSVVRAERSPATWISTVEQDGVVSIRLHPDIELGVAGRTGRHVAEKLPRTVLSNVGAVESPTAFLVRREMQSWQLLQLEPAALRAPDDYGAPPSITTSGAHLPATLARLAGQLPQAPTDQPPAAAEHAAAVYAQVANRLAELIDGVRSIRVIADDQRELLTLMLTDRANTE